MGNPWWGWIVVVGVPLICLLGGMIARSFAGRRSGLDSKELAVVRRAARVGGGEFVGRTLGYGFLAALQVPPPLDLRAFRHYKDRAAAKKDFGFDPRKQNRAEGVIFWFHELRLTRTELIKGYEENAQRIPLHGLTATVRTGQTVQITIEGPRTKFVYRNAFDARSNLRRAQQFAALLNYEASLQGAPL
ncbi:hypothetical protein H7K24_01430 [Mycobacterium fragae]|jgi:hypothetical protein|uniref:Uncharacterized protein n=1 Tax=Mycobacterium fragae TaxID=1260918 RepID=A0A1X1V0Q6_9MYCO|nr:hypothetical protein [Mycobacterium fragae]MCV7398814.1 hypothetical protein [Mycobacterium fragae]ORV62644.1 hypothetical protein AWC06_10385 [Mycobacterium fragae]